MVLPVEGTMKFTTKQYRLVGLHKSIWEGSLLLFFFLFNCIILHSQVVITGDDVVCQGDRASLHAEVSGVSIGTTSYNFAFIDYGTHPAFSGGAAIDQDFINCNANYDDCWAGGTPPNHDGYDIGFTFCFFNQLYTKFYVGSNGWIGFTDPTGHSWTTYTATTIPNTYYSVPKNCIFAPWQDWYPGYQGIGPNVFYYKTGSVGSRKLVVYWLDCPLYNCRSNNSIRGTFMIVLYEGTSVIENFIQAKPNCPSSNEGATQGVHNAEGTIAFTATGRNYDVWEAFDEGTRFEPSGIIWYQDLYPGGAIVGYGPDIVVNPIVTTQYFAVVGTCNGGTAQGTFTVNVSPTPPAPIITGSNEVCQNISYLFTAQPGMQNYLWSYPGAVLVSGGGNSDDFIELKWLSPGNKTISANFSNSFGCTATNPTEKTISVNPTPNVVPSSSSPLTICSGTNAQVGFSSSVPGTTTNTTFNWTASGNAGTITPNPSTISGSGNILKNLSNSGNISEPVVFHILPAAAGCSPTVPYDFTFKVNPVPFTQPSPGTQQIICNGATTLPITLQTNVSGLSPTYNWTSLCDPPITNCPPASGNSNPIFSFTPGNSTTSQKTITFTIVASLSATSGSCSGPQTEYAILINPMPVATFTTSTPSPVCQDFPTPSLYTVDPGGPSSTYSWNVSPAANAIIANPTANPASITWKLSGSSPQIAQLTVTATTSGTTPSCSSTSVPMMITINPKPPTELAACFDLVTTQDAKPFYLKGGTPLGSGGAYYIDATLVPTGNKLDPSTLSIGNHTISYSYTSTNTCIASDAQQIVVKVANPPCGLSMTDYRDGSGGTVYTTALLPDGKCWMTQNLRYGTLSPSVTPQTDNCTVEKYCLSTDPTCANGGFYQWDQLIQFGITDGPEYQGVCPPGWHIPTQVEWQDLINNVAGFTPGDGVAGGYLKDQNQTNGFKALLKGIYYLNDAWAFTSGNSLTATMFWTGTPSSGDRAIARGMNNYNYSVSLYESFKENAFPVRCVKD